MEVFSFSAQDIIILFVSLTTWIVLYLYAQATTKKGTIYDRLLIFIVLTAIVFVPFAFLLVTD